MHVEAGRVELQLQAPTALPACWAEMMSMLTPGPFHAGDGDQLVGYSLLFAGGTCHMALETVMATATTKFLSLGPWINLCHKAV